MAQLKDTLIQGSARVTDTLYTSLLKVTDTISAKQFQADLSSDGTDHAKGIKFGNGSTYILTNTSGTMLLESDASFYFRKTSNASTGVYINPGTEVCPEGNGTIALGGASKRWSGVYSKTLNARVNKSVLIGTGTAAAGTDTKTPALWKYDLGIATPEEGDVIIIKIPVAGSGNGVFVSLDNGTTYKPCACNTSTGSLTTHYAVDTFVTLVYDADGQVNGIYPVAGASAATNITGGCWRVMNYYVDGAPYGMRVYRQTTGYNGDYPILVSRSLASSIGTSGANGSNTNNIYGIIWNDTTKTPTVNPSTGVMKVPGGITDTKYNGLTLTAASTGFTIAGGTASKTLTVSATYTLGDACAKAVTDSTSNSALGTGTSLTTERDVYYGLVTVNGASQTRATGIYAPTSVGTSGQYLKSGGSGAPTWASFSSSTVGLGNVTNDAQVKASLGTTKGDIVYWSAANTPARLAIGSAGQALLVSSSGIPSWGTVSTANYYHTSGSWDGLTYTATANGGTGAGTLSFTIPTGTSGTTVALGNHTHSYLSTGGGTLTGALTLKGDLSLYTASNDAPDIVWFYANGSSEKARIWLADAYTAAEGPYYRCYNSSGTSLYSGNLVIGTLLENPGAGYTTYAAYVNSSAPSVLKYTDKIAFNNGSILCSQALDSSFIAGSHGANFYVSTASTAAAGNAYDPWVGGKTYSGAWSMGVVSGSDDLKFIYGTDTNFSTQNNEVSVITFGTGGQVWGAVWNDYAEYRKQYYDIEPGRVVYDLDDGHVMQTEKRLMPGAQVVSDTFGFAIGETKECKTPLAVSGRVLVYTHRNRYDYHAGDAVCSAPNGTVDIMTREEIKEHPDAIIGIVSEIPEYNTWGSNEIPVKGRIWIKVR